MGGCWVSSSEEGWNVCRPSTSPEWRFSQIFSQLPPCEGGGGYQEQPGQEEPTATETPKEQTFFQPEESESDLFVNTMIHTSQV